MALSLSVMALRWAVFLSLATAVVSNPPCTADTALQQGQNMQQFMSSFYWKLMNSYDAVRAGDAGFQQWLSKKTDCQSTCLKYQFQQAVDNLWRTGQLFGQNYHADTAEALTGAFKTCYPMADRSTQVQPMMVRVVSRMLASRRLLEGGPLWDLVLPDSSTNIDSSHEESRRLQVACPNSAETSQAFVAHVMSNFDSAMQQVSATDQQVSTFFTTTAKTCQFPCARNVLQQGMKTFYMDNTYVDPIGFASYATDIVTGSLKACFSSIPHDVAQSLAAPIVKSIQAAPGGSESFSSAYSGSSTCIDDGQLQQGSNLMQFMGSFKGQLGSSFAATQREDPHFAAYLGTQLACQQQCMYELWENAVAYMWKTGTVFGNGAPALLTEALTGGFKACYPAPNRDDVLIIVGKTVAKMTGGRRLRSVEAADDIWLLRDALSRQLQQTSAPGGQACPKSGQSKSGAGKSWVDNTLNQLKPAMDQAFASDPVVRSTYGASKACQGDCAYKALTLSLQNFWDTDMMSDETKSLDWLQQLVTGAIKSCYPKLDRTTVLTIMSKVIPQAAVSVPKAEPQHCIPPTTLMKGMNYQQFHSKILPMIQSRFTEGVSATPGMKSVLEAGKTCQFPCFQDQVEFGLQVLWAAESGSLDNLAEMLTGSFKSCYPQPNRQDILNFMTPVAAWVAASMGRRLNLAETDPLDISSWTQASHRRLQSATSCMPEVNVQGLVASFMAKFPAMMQAVSDENPQAHAYFNDVAKDCQHTCSRDSVSRTITNYFAAGMPQDHTLLSEAITGAMKVCYPVIPRADLLDIVKEVNKRNGYTRLYALVGDALEGRPLTAAFGAAIAVTSFLALVSMVVGARRLLRRALAAGETAEADEPLTTMSLE